jgi:hypothetical protein
LGSEFSQAHPTQLRPNAALRSTDGAGLIMTGVLIEEALISLGIGSMAVALCLQWIGKYDEFIRIKQK